MPQRRGRTTLYPLLKSCEELFVCAGNVCYSSASTCDKKRKKRRKKSNMMMMMMMKQGKKKKKKKIKSMHESSVNINLHRRRAKSTRKAPSSKHATCSSPRQIYKKRK